MAVDPAKQRKRVPVLILYKEDVVVQTLPLTRTRITIGRRTFNDLVIESINVSAEHAVVLTMFDQLCYEDLGSTNGSRINGEKIVRYFLNEGDVIDFGSHTVAFRMETVYEEQLPTKVEIKPDIDLIEVLPEVPALYKPVAIESLEHVASTSTTLSDDLLYPPPPLPNVPRSEQATAVIRILTGPRAGHETVLSKSLTTIGFPNRQVAVLTPAGESWAVTSLSKEPPFLNGVPLKGLYYRLSHGDTIAMGGIECLFYLDWWFAARAH